jgi:ketosteroid isomerase-like protein
LSSANADAPAKFYAKDDGLGFTISPSPITAEAEYHDGVQKEFFDNASSVKLSVAKDLKVTRRGNIAWMTVPMHIALTTKDGKTKEAEIRYTGIWERRGSSWLIVHEHLSAPMG